MLRFAHPSFGARFLLSLTLCLTLFARASTAQQTETPPPPTQDDDVLRITTELVQTDVTVFDKKGNFIDNLKPEDFELRVDGRPQPITFFERVKAGTVDEDAQLAAARGGASRRAGGDAAAGGIVKPLDRGRTFVFFVDDLHLSPSNVEFVRKAIRQFITAEMGQNDVAAITSATGQIGFLQQFTSNKAVLRAALERIKRASFSRVDTERPPMSEYQALRIEQNDRDFFNFFVEQVISANPGMQRQSAESIVSGRARTINSHSNLIARNMLSTLSSLVKTSSQLPGRKVVFLMSEGFLLNRNAPEVTDALRRITDAAARAGVVIYTMDARGLVSGAVDASSEIYAISAAGLERVNFTESSAISASQEVLRTLAYDTGGRPLLNSNSLDAGLARTVKETSVYYLLAWRPEQQQQRDGGRKAKYHKVEVGIKGRSELKVLGRRGFFDTAPPPVAEKKSDGKKNAAKGAASPSKPRDPLAEALGAVHPKTDLAIALSVGYRNEPAAGLVLTTSVEVEREGLEFAPASADAAGAATTKDGTRQTAKADVLGVVYDVHGKPVSSFKDQLTVRPPREDEGGEPAQRIMYSRHVSVSPGLYQVRVASRDLKSGRAGSATEWIEIPDLTKGRLTLSSIFVAERTGGAEAAAVGGNDDSVLLSVDRRFSRNSLLRFLLHIYNAANAQAPDVALQAQVFRDDQPVVTTPLRKVDTSGQPDLAHINYAAELNLAGLPAGRYVLQITAIDRAAKVSAWQRVNFSIE